MLLCSCQRVAGLCNRPAAASSRSLRQQLLLGLGFAACMQTCSAAVEGARLQRVMLSFAEHLLWQC